MLLQNLLAIVREDLKCQSGSRPRRGARFQQGQSIFCADRKLAREFNDTAFRQLALKRLGVCAISKKQISAVFSDMPGIDVPIRRRLQRSWAAGQLYGLGVQPLAAAWLNRLGTTETSHA